MKAARNFAIVGLVALVIVLLPGGGPALNVVLALLAIAFFTAIAFLGYRMYRENRFLLDSLEQSHKLVLYGSIGLAFLTFTASPRLFNTGLGIVVWIFLLVLASYGVFWVWTQSRRYG